MKSSRRFLLLVLLLGAGGTALFIVLIIRQGASDIGHALGTAGWWMGVIVAFHLLPLLADAIAWRALLPRKHRLSLFSFFWMRWAGEGITNLLPFAQIGGDIVRARLAST